MRSENFDYNCQLLLNKKLILNENPSVAIGRINDSVAELERTNALFDKDDVILHGRSYHSRRDPYREATKQAADLKDRGAAAVIHLSPGLGFLPRELSKSMTQLVLEFDLVALAKNLYHYKWPENMFLYVIEDWRTENLESILPFLQGKNMKHLLSRAHPPALIAFPEESETLQSRLASLLEKRSINQATLVKFQELWNQNYLRNLSTIIKSGTLTDLLQVMKPQTIVIAGAGPSLSDSISILKDNRAKYFLIAADTAFIPLAENEIYPDICIAADPQPINRYFVYHKNVNRSLWLVDPVVCSSLVHHLNRVQARVLFWNSAFKLDSYVRGLVRDRGEIQHGGSVATNAWDLARLSTASKVYLVGQDLAFPGSTAHVKGAALESSVLSRVSRLQTAEQHNHRQMSAMPKEPVPSLKKDDENLFTNGKLQVFRQWFSRQSMLVKENRFYNGTSRGAVIENLEHVNLAEQLKSRPTEEITSISADPSQLNDGTAEAKKLIKGLYLDMENLGDLYRKNAKLAIHQDISTLQKLAKNDDKIKKLSLANEFLGLSAQDLLLSITEQGEEVSPVEFYKTMHQTALGQSHILKRTLRQLDK